ncbi:RNA-binding S4 domain-containing protein [Demequina sp.]|uniref:RNA-binding S4 domain-containing protein n=1 Tax=Demequina sp. TaxID=2050685 RepID=UPI003D128A47
MSTRIDAWLWAVRIYKSRTQATAACRAGHVRINGEKAKASTTVVEGSTVVVRVGGRDRVFEVVHLLSKRVGPEPAAAAYIDRTPKELPRDVGTPAFATRDRGAGRPTKRERRQIDRLRGR